MATLTDKNGTVERSTNSCRAVRRKSDTRSRPINAKKSSGKTGIRRNKRSVTLIIGFLLLSAATAAGDSLWSTEFSGYLDDEQIIEIGDTVIVKIDADFSLSFRSTSVDSKTFTLEFGGGEYGELFSFLPQIRASGDQDVKGSDELQLSSELAVRVTEIAEDGLLYVQGSRTIAVMGKEESLSLSGWLDPKDVGRNREIPFSRIADLRLVYRSLIQPEDEVLRDEDIEAVLQELVSPEQESAPPAEEAAAGEEEGVGAAAVEAAPTGEEGGQPEVAAEETPAGPATPSLTEEKKKELFLRYVNRLLDLIFQ